MANNRIAGLRLRQAKEGSMIEIEYLRFMLARGRGAISSLERQMWGLSFVVTSPKKASC
jgi:hypothetical protein